MGPPACPVASRTVSAPATISRRETDRIGFVYVNLQAAAIRGSIIPPHVHVVRPAGIRRARGARWALNAVHRLYIVVADRQGRRFSPIVKGLPADLISLIHSRLLIPLIIVQ